MTSDKLRTSWKKIPGLELRSLAKRKTVKLAASNTFKLLSTNPENLKPLGGKITLINGMQGFVFLSGRGQPGGFVGNIKALITTNTISGGGFLLVISIVQWAPTLYPNY